MSPLAHVVALPVRAYRLLLSPWLGHGCRFQPTCSAYALEALERHGAVRGGWLALRRLMRCHPWGGQGYDPVPGADPAHDRATREGAARDEATREGAARDGAETRPGQRRGPTPPDSR